MKNSRKQNDNKDISVNEFEVINLEQLEKTVFRFEKTVNIELEDTKSIINK